MGRPREVVLRRAPTSVLVEEVDALEVDGGQSWGGVRNSVGRPP